MANPTKGVPVELDKKRHLRYPIYTLKEMEGAGLGRVLWLGLKHEDEELTEEQVEEMVDLSMLTDLEDPLKKATGGLFDIGKLFEAAHGAAEKKGPKTKRRKGS